jgi:SAM-dependent methyltransferase
VLEDRDRDRLLSRVRGWFEAPAQVRHYREEAASGPTPAEAWLLQALPATGRVLDLGCGAGRLTTILARCGYEVVGADVSPALLRVADGPRREGGGARFLRVDPLRLPFRDATFDAALACKVYGYLPGREARRRYLDSVGRLLRPGAPLLLTQYVVTAEIFRTYRREADHQRAAAHFPTLESGDAFTLGGEGYLHVFTPTRLRRELGASGLDLVSFVSDREHGGDGWLRLATLTIRRDCPALRGTGRARRVSADDRALLPDVAVRAAVAGHVLRGLGEAVPDAQAALRGSLADGRADAYSDIDVLWELPDDRFATGMERLGTVLAAVRPVESLRSDPVLQRSHRHRLVFVRFAGLPLFWRLDLEVFARSAGRDPACDLDNPAAHGTDWSVAESALANAVAAIKAHRRRQEDVADALLARAFRRLGQPPSKGVLVARIIALTRLAAELEPAISELAERVVAQALAALA